MSADRPDIESLLALLEDVLIGPTRATILAGISARGTAGDHQRRLRSAMAAHEFKVEDATVDLARLVRRLDHRTRQDGFRVLHAWNHRTHAFTDDIVPVLILDFLERAGGDRATFAPNAESTLAIVLDYYFLHLLTLCSTRVWDSADPDAALDRLTGLLHALQGADGSGHQFLADSASLLIYALSQFHPEETAYDRVIERVQLLDARHQMAFATVSASVLSAHLRWGFWLMYGRDVVRMRRDNVGDYPWLLNSILTLARAYVAHVEGSASEATPEAVGSRDRVVQALLQGLAADPWAFRGTPPPALVEHRAAYDELIDILRNHTTELLADLARQAPDKKSYAPLGLHFNFPHNTLVAIVTLALLEGRPQPLPLNLLFEPEVDTSATGETQEGLARALMAFSQGSPDRLGHRGAMLVAYDPLSGLRSYSLTVDTLRKAFGD